MMEARFVPSFADAKRLWSARLGPVAPNLASGSGKLDRNSARCSGLLLIPDGPRKPTGRTNLWAFSACFSAPMTLAYLELLRTTYPGHRPRENLDFLDFILCLVVVTYSGIGKNWKSKKRRELETRLFKSFNQF